MYNNIGSKIKGLALGTFIALAFISVISGLVFMLEDEDMIPIGLLMIIGGPLIAWISSWVLYGFGELIDKTTEIADNTAGIHKDAYYTERKAKLDALLAQGAITADEHRRALNADR